MNLLISPASPEERYAALRLFFQHVANNERETRVERALALVAQRELPPEGVLVCRDGETLLGVIAVLVLEGAAGLIWPPQAVGEPAFEAVEDELIGAAIAWLRQRGVKFAQSLLTHSDVPFVGSLERNGFTHITTLVYLQKDLTPGDADATLSYEACTVCDLQRFNKTLLASYERTLDCPELNDLRTIEEILAGYRAVPGCRLDRWWLAYEGDQAVGVLITVPVRDSTAWELAYVGLVPAARRRGFGTALTHQAMAQAWAAGAGRMTLTVDLRNEPARRMYRALGFVEFDRREVYLAVFAKA